MKPDIKSNLKPNPEPSLKPNLEPNIKPKVEFDQLSIQQIQEALKSKKVAAVELANFYLQNIKKLNPQLNAFLQVTEEIALAQAGKIDKKIAKGEGLGPLGGIPAAHKDIFCTQGVETTAGSNILKGFIPPYDATVVQKIKQAGAIMLGKTNQDAFAHGSSGENSDFGPTKNPWDPGRVPGGSSSGSAAAVASGMCLFATATDTGGSIRNPAAFCNLTGIKPTYGRVSRYGVIAMASSMDSPGVIAKTVKDCAYVLNQIAGRDSLDATTALVPVPNYIRNLNKPVKGLRLGVPKQFFTAGLDKQIKKALQAALQELAGLGLKIEEVSLPHAQYTIAAYYILVPSEISSNLARYDGIKYGFSEQTGQSIQDIYFDSRSRGFGSEAKRRIMLGTFSLSSGYYEAYYQKAQKVRTLIRQDFERVFQKVNLLLGPVAPDLPFKLGEKSNDPLKLYLEDIFTAPVNLAGLPGLALPCGFSQEKLPIGMQLIGPAFSEELLFRIGHAYQQVTNWHQQSPYVKQSFAYG